MTSRPSAFETRLAAMNGCSNDLAEATRAQIDEDASKNGRRFALTRFLSAVTLFATAMTISALDPELAPICLVALALGLLVMLIVARLQPHGETSVTFSLRHANGRPRRDGMD